MTHEMNRPIPAELQRVGNHPHTDEPLVFLLEYSVTSNDRIEYYFAAEPEKPTRDYSEWNSDDELVYYTRTDNELAEALVNYERAHAAWVKAGSPRGPTPFVAEGPAPTVEGKFATASGATCSGQRGPEGWHWQRWDTVKPSVRVELGQQRKLDEPEARPLSWGRLK